MSEGKDILLPKVIEFAKGRESISCADIQNEFTLDYNRSARLMDQLEYEGIISQFSGAKARTVFVRNADKAISPIYPPNQLMKEAIGFADWLYDTGWRAVDSVELDKRAWVDSSKHDILINGSDYHFTKLIKDHGKSLEDVYQLYKQ